MKNVSSHEYIYKSINSLQKCEDPKIHKTCLDYFYVNFFQMANIQYKIMASQYLLRNHINTNQTEEALISISSDTSLEHHLRADSADVLIRLGSEEARKTARNIISILGKNVQGISTVYNNLENVHNEQIEKHVSDFLLELGSVKIDQKDPKNSYDKIVSSIVGSVQGTKYEIDLDKINGSLLRIKLDQIIYPGSQLLTTIFIKLYNIIQGKEPTIKSLLIDRLLEELIDMDKTCSSGHCSRLVNTFSGIDGFSLKIGFEEQIHGNILGRLRKRINDIEDEKYRDQVLDEMTQPEEVSRPNFGKFYKDNIDSLHKELYEEFVTGQYLDQDSFETYFRSGTTYFETGSKI